ncbi:glycosyltransferase family 2 protein [Neotamlana laminarinivorans]|uniref:Glycosyltransferase family 2 protein n=1 Tax=Neotamlana laminarinivorans TaxID=2883124 RepID=A0A9X1L2E1_9FLAO|nr:glycosyltransferase family 2 protein [Tamlana laminarinivorans]MCB4799693.1 glycosyltransferase family 2 protein [Tamlana laminarinivorans]
MKLGFKVSVIIPVYNCERFIEKAVRSALQQPEVAEIVVVNDGSTDNSLKLLKTLQIEDERVKIHHHKNKKNKGRATSRNLGIKKASSNYIAFLDADDFYLENRFKTDAKVFLTQNEADGVYNAVGFHYYRNVSENDANKTNLCTLSQGISPNEIFEAFMLGKGHLHLNGLTLKKEAIRLSGLFNSKLTVGEDTDFIYKLALKCKLFAGVVTQAAALRGVHENNVFSNRKVYSKYHGKTYESLIVWSAKNNVSLTRIDKQLSYLWFFYSGEKNKFFNQLLSWVKIFMSSFRLFFSNLNLKYFPIVNLIKK